MKTIFSLLVCLLTSQNLLAHKKFIQGVIEHSHYLEGLQVKSFGDLRLIRKSQLRNGKQITLTSDLSFSSCLHNLSRHVVVGDERIFKFARCIKVLHRLS